MESRTDGARLPAGNRSAYVGTAAIEDIDGAKSILLVGTNPDFRDAAGGLIGGNNMAKQVFVRVD